jgi:fatty acyl-CoA reductase
VTGREIFQILKEKRGNGFEGFIQEKICPLPGDVMYENLGLAPTKLRELWKEIDIIVNGAATTNFYERYELISVYKLFHMAGILRKYLVNYIYMAKLQI